jgi:hypothetical protein
MTVLQGLFKMQGHLLNRVQHTGLLLFSLIEARLPETKAT